MKQKHLPFTEKNKQRIQSSRGKGWKLFMNNLIFIIQRCIEYFIQFLSAYTS